MLSCHCCSALALGLLGETVRGLDHQAAEHKGTGVAATAARAYCATGDDGTGSDVSGAPPARRVDGHRSGNIHGHVPAEGNTTGAVTPVLFVMLLRNV